MSVAQALPRRAVGPYVREVGAASVLAAIVAVSAMLAFDAASAPTDALRWTLSERPYPGWLAGPFAGLGHALSDDQFFFDVLVLFALWAVVYSSAEYVRLSWAVGAIVLAHVVFTLAPPLGLSDVFNYIGYGRAAVEHGHNPYTVHLQQIAQDPVFPYVTWPEWNNPYGPLSTLSFLPLSLFGVPQALWLVKVSVGAASLACVWLVGRCAQELGQPRVPAMLFVGLNPQLLVYAVGGAHNDVFIVLFMLLGIFWVLTERERLSGAALAAAAAVKMTGGLILPFVLLAARRRRDLLLGAAVAAAALWGVALILWGPHLLIGLEQQRDVESLRSVPGLYAKELFGAHGPTSAMLTVGGVGMVLAVAGLLWHTWRGGFWIDAAGWTTLCLLLVLTWLMPWYMIWLLPLAALSTSRRLRTATFALSLLTILMRAPTPLLFDA